MECLNKDKDSMLAFYDYPAEHWPHIRTTNPIESVLPPYDYELIERRIVAAEALR